MVVATMTVAAADVILSSHAQHITIVRTNLYVHNLSFFLSSSFVHSLCTVCRIYYFKYFSILSAPTHTIYYYLSTHFLKCDMLDKYKVYLIYSSALHCSVYNTYTRLHIYLPPSDFDAIRTLNAYK